jgi:replicative DNA helicase
MKIYIEFEELLIGLLIIDNSLIDKLHDKIETFESPTSNTLINTIFELHIQDGFVDLVTLSNRLREIDEWDNIGGVTYLSYILEKKHEIDTIRKVVSFVLE